MNPFGNVICFNTPKAWPLSCVTSPIQKEKIKIVILSILNVLAHTDIRMKTHACLFKWLNLAFESTKAEVR